MDWIKALNPDSPVQQYLRWMEGGGNDALYEAEYARTAAEAQAAEGGFLSVIIRTQGKRPAMLQDVMTCLAAQRDQDFEVILICHRTGETEYRDVEAMIEEQAPALAKRVRVFRSDRGERGAPLNLGFALARGAYAVCLDDDDLVFDHWVEAFHEASREHEGMILHSWAVAQEWRADKNTEGKAQRLYAAGTPDNKYCVPYRTLRQQSENYCPFMGLAFPLFLFREMHILFNEELTTTEDWDYLLRTAGIAGVWDIPKVTAIYRLWTNARASRQQVREPEWKSNYRAIGRQVSRMPLLLTADEAEECREELTGLQFAGQKGRNCYLREAVLFWSDETGAITGNQYMTAPILLKDGWMRTAFPLQEQAAKYPVTRLRFDPAEETLFTLEELHVRFMDGETVLDEWTMEDIQETNGLTEGKKILFLAEDPRIILGSGKAIPASTAVFTARVTYESPEVLNQWAEDLCADARWLEENRGLAHLYMDKGNGYSMGSSLKAEDVFQGEQYEAVFDFPAGEGTGIRKMRFDPTEAGMISIGGLRIDITYEDGGTETLGAGEVQPVNGFTTGDGVTFLERDPWITIPIREEAAVARVRVTGTARWIDGDEAEDLFAQADNVPDYGLVCGQMVRVRQEYAKRKKDKKELKEPDDAAYTGDPGDADDLNDANDAKEGDGQKP